MLVHQRVFTLSAKLLVSAVAVCGSGCLRFLVAGPSSRSSAGSNRHGWVHYGPLVPQKLARHKINMGVSENSVPLNPMVNDPYPY